jgi:hypothetical protein
VDDDDVAGAVAVGMGVFFGGTAVGCPTGMSDAVAAIDGVDLQYIFEISQFSGGAADAEGLVIAIDGDTGGVVAAVFESLETIQNDRNSPLSSYVAYDSTHISIVRSNWCTTTRILAEGAIMLAGIFLVTCVGPKPDPTTSGLDLGYDVRGMRVDSAGVD